LNYDVRDFNVPLQLMAIELTAGLVVPLLAALYPVLSGTRVTVQQAISNPGVPQVGGGARLRLARRIGRVPMALRYAMRNMFRRKARLALTLMALSLGGAIMISVLSVYASLFATLDQLADYWRQDVRVTFQQPQRIDQIARVALRVPGVIGLEYQTSKRGARQRSNATLPNKTTAIFALLPDSQFLRPQVVQGRWLAPGDRNAAVVNLHFLEQEPDVAVGDMITLDIEGRTTTWRVVGVVAYEILPVAPPQFEQPNVFVSYGPFAEAMDELGTANEALIVTERHNMEFQRHVRLLLDAQLAHSTLPGVVVTHTELRSQITSIYRTLILLLLVMALLFTVVGGLGLTGAMSLNMLERTKELGVLRAVGASNTKVLQIVLTEGLCTGALSWLLAAVLALPLSKMLSNAIGMSLQRWPLIYTFPLVGMLIWLGVVMIVAAIASYVPARSAAQLSVRDVLAYE
jgi:putative ABC transport system permease protein